MRRQQLIQLLQFIIVWVGIRAFVVFIMKESFVDFILKYWLFLLILSVSYFYYYSIEYEPDKKYQFIRNVIIYGNAYLFAHIFFRPFLNISHELFVLLGLIILGLWGTTKMKSRWKYLLQILGGILSFFILISGVFYLYPDAPDIRGFINSRKYEISVIGATDSINKTDAYIQIVDNRKSNDFQIIPLFNKVLMENCRVSYPSLKEDRDEKLIIMSPYGDIVQLFPQSEVQLQFSGGELVRLSKLRGRVGYLSGVFTGTMEFSGEFENFSGEELMWIEGVQYGYKYDFVDYLKNQISDSNIGWANNTIMYNIDGKIISFLVKLFPTSFSKNLRNYNQFQGYFAWILEDEVDLGRYSMQQTGVSISSFRGSLKNGMNAGKSNAYNIFKKH